MANINKIKLSGTTYNIEDLNATKTVELTQAQYDALVDKDPNTFYIITDAQGGDLSNYYTKSETSGATQISTALNAKADTATTYTKSEVDTALDSKQATLVSGTNIKTINNESLLGSGNIDIQGGGGSSYTAGRGISITNNTISFNLPISAGTRTDSIIEGSNTTANGEYSHAEGFYTTASGDYGSHAEGYGTNATNHASHAEGNHTTASGYYSHAEGFGTTASGDYGSHAEGNNTNATNESEHASGRYNVSNKSNTTFGDSGNTLFSVGNGTSDSARHNAFEIRQNGDIYVTKDGQDVKLQDQLGGGSSYTAGDGIDITNDVISVTGKVDTTTYNTYTAATDTALASKQTTLTAGTGINITDNVISATGGGGGKAISGGTNISITTGETADTINCTLPITATTGSSNIELAIGENATTQVSYNSEHNGGIAIGYNTYAKRKDIVIGGFARNRGDWNDNILIGFKTSGYSESVCIGSFSKGYNGYQAGTVSLGYSAQAANMKNAVAIGYEVSTKGTTKTNINNQIKIDSSNQVYISNSANTSTYCLQEKIENTEAALGGLSLVKLTQAQYDALETKDNSTLYIIIN